MVQFLMFLGTILKDREKRALGVMVGEDMRGYGSREKRMAFTPGTFLPILRQQR